MNDHKKHFVTRGHRGTAIRAALITLPLLVISFLLVGQGTSNSSQSRAEGKAGKAAVVPAPDVKPASKQLTSVAPGTPYNQRVQLLERGKLVYQRYCIGCHGDKGDGQGPASTRLITQPRDFTRGIYKFRTTDSSSLPMEADLHRTITRGLARVSMPAFPLMVEQDKVAVIQYIKDFYPNWESEAPDRKLVFVPNPPQDLDSKERISRGRVVYLAMGCANCHGQDGAGTGAVQHEFVDAWGHKQLAFNFTRGRLKSGDDPQDIYRVFHAGLRSIMPAFPGETLAFVTGEQVGTAERFFTEGEPATLKDAISQFPAGAADIAAMTTQERLDRATNNSWDLVAYIQSLRVGGGKATGKSASATPVTPATPATPATPKKSDEDLFD
ncbi:MAG: c-type cytochrome [Phycisphaeraceae bacterium]